MGYDDMLTLICGIILLGAIVGAVVIRLKRKPSTDDENSAKEFLEGLSDTFYNKMIDIINHFDFSAYKSLPELEVDLINQIYDSVWEYVEEQLKDQAQTDVLTALALKVLNKEFVTGFVDTLIERFNINENISNMWNSLVAEKEADTVEEDKKLQEEFNDPDKYVEDLDTKDLPPVEEKVITEEEKKNLNPPTEEDPVYDATTDDSVEVISEDYVIDENDPSAVHIDI